jgi:uncharacterized protein YeaO (DUF488 family)
VAVRIVRLGTPRARGEGLRLGTVRRLPRGVRKADYAKRNFFDLWLPELSPSEKLVKLASQENLTSQTWRRFAAAYRREMAQPAPKRLLAVIAALSREADFSVGCYCEDESRCHRSLLRALLVEAGAKVR